MRWLALAACAWPAALGAQGPPTTAPAARVRVVVYQFTSATQDSNSAALARRVTRALVARLVADSAFEVLGRPTSAADSAPARPKPQYAIIGGVVIAGSEGRVDLRLLDIATVQMIARKTVMIPDRFAADAPTMAGRQLARLVREHFIR
jgi:TolB-like protein